MYERHVQLPPRARGPRPATDGPPVMHVSALYLPQFHPTPENDAWWGRGFTEWTNVAKARPLFPGHKQPNLPGELGFYDLRVSESRQLQAELAMAHGVDSFAVWHYWFGGRKILERPLEQSLAEPAEGSFRFFFNWANESWQGRWHGAGNETLIEQTYPGADDDRDHFHYLEPFFHSDRYVRLDGRPIMAIYKPRAIPNLDGLIERWNTLAQSSGLGSLYWIAQLDHPDDLPAVKPRFDQCYLNPGQLWSYIGGIDHRVFDRLKLPRLVDASKFPGSLESFLREHPSVTPCLMPDWDNTPRARRDGNVWVRNAPEVFAAQVRIAFDAVARAGRPVTEQLVMVKSWNEWAETNCLEPGRRHGRRYLESIRDIRAARGLLSAGLPLQGSRAPDRVLA